jgi:hypothetical protein
METGHVHLKKLFTPRNTILIAAFAALPFGMFMDWATQKAQTNEQRVAAVEAVEDFKFDATARKLPPPHRRCFPLTITAETGETFSYQSCIEAEAYSDT